jgi:excinuclease UvrABC nuclease subunit
MDSVGIAKTFVAQSQAETAQVLQSKMLKMSAQQDASLVALLQQGAENLQSVQSSSQAALPAGLGAQVDVTA